MVGEEQSVFLTPEASFSTQRPFPVYCLKYTLYSTKASTLPGIGHHMPYNFQ